MEVIVNLVMSKSSGFRCGGGVAETGELVATAVVPTPEVQEIS
jgi:hypothetical protein